MNNEEKILQLLEQMGARQSRTEQMLEQMQGEVSGLKTEIGMRFDAVDEKLNLLEMSINAAAKDAQTSIKRHEKEFHMV